MMSYWLDSDEGDLEEYVDAALFVDVQNAATWSGWVCGDQMVTAERVVYECSSEPEHPGRHVFINLVDEDRTPVVLAAWPGAHRPGDGDEDEVMPS
jgi:hypothetical protein